jgi:2-oxoglutarate ferredoxin oxidoreductase subunit delta
MANIQINKDRCKGCLLCVAFCPKGLIKKEKNLNRRGVAAAEFSDPENACLGCMMCALICPDCCIEVYK